MLECKGPLCNTIAPNILAEVSKEVKIAATGQKKKQGSYLSFTLTEKAQVLQYSAQCQWSLSSFETILN